MNRAWWIMGGTAVGKKLFIGRCMEGGDPVNIGIRKGALPVWLNDGPPVLAQLMSAVRDRDALIRWQHGRESEMANALSKCENHIVLLFCSPEVQERRATGREGENRWSARRLYEESCRVGELVFRLAHEHGIPVHVFDTTDGQYRRLR